MLCFSEDYMWWGITIAIAIIPLRGGVTGPLVKSWGSGVNLVVSGKYITWAGIALSGLVELCSVVCGMYMVGRGVWIV